MTTQAQKFYEELEATGTMGEDARNAFWDAICAKGVVLPTASHQSYTFPDGSSVRFGTDADGDTPTQFLDAGRDII